MLGDLPAGIVPPGQYPTTDLSSYAFFEEAARNILAKCMSPVLRKGIAHGGFDITGISYIYHALYKPPGFY